MKTMTVTVKRRLKQKGFIPLPQDWAAKVLFRGLGMRAYKRVSKPK